MPRVQRRVFTPFRPAPRQVCPLGLAIALVSLGPTSRTAADTQRRAYLDWMAQALPAVPTWSEWQRRTNAMPPDFAALPSANFLPDPFTFHDGRPMAMPADWPARRTEIKSLFQKYVIGSLPPKPALGRVTPVGEPVNFPGYSTRTATTQARAIAWLQSQP